MDYTHSADVGANVRAEMARHGMGQVALAASIGLSQTALSRRLRGATRWAVDDVYAVADALGVPVGDLMPQDAGTPVRAA